MNDWFEKRLKRLNVRKSEMDYKKSNDVEIGRMYMFVYDPKTPGLPYYDKTPLVMPFSKSMEGFTAINFHILPPQLRIGVLSQVAEFAELDESGERVAAALNYHAMKLSSSVFKPAVRSYLNSHVRTNYSQVHSDEWANVIALSQGSFVGAGRSEVFKQTREKLRNG